MKINNKTAGFLTSGDAFTGDSAKTARKRKSNEL